jgi:hypothetical protein
VTSVRQADGDDGSVPVEHQTYTELHFDTSTPGGREALAHVVAATCDDCGEFVPIPGWPFCRSEQNPDGHERGTYRWKTKFSMKTHGWTRRLR